MGNCVRKNVRVMAAPTTSDGYGKNLSLLRESLIFHIVGLHIIIVGCRRGIDECYFKRLKNVAVILRGKELQAKRKIGELQDLVKNLDENLIYESKTRTKAIIAAGKMLIKECSTAIFFNDMKELLQNKQEYNSLIKSQLFSLSFKETAVLIEIEKEFKEKACLTEKGNENPIRRKKYFKTFQIR